VFGAAIDQGYAWLVVIGALASAVAAFFYLRVLVVMYMQDPDGGRAPAVVAGIPSYAVIGVTALSTLGLGLAWGPLFDVIEDATFFF
jgi:NADH-quinone oxidoreductase subunit N